MEGEGVEMVYGRRGEMEHEVAGSAGGRRVEQIRQKGAEGDERGGDRGDEGSAGELEEEEVGASEEGGVLGGRGEEEPEFKEMEIGGKEMEKEVGIMVKFGKGKVMELHLFPNKEAMRKWRGEDSEQDAEGEYREWSVPLEVIEDLWAAAMGEE